jgi:hypothetical protein
LQPHRRGRAAQLSVSVCLVGVRAYCVRLGGGCCSCKRAPCKAHAKRTTPTPPTHLATTSAGVMLSSRRRSSNCWGAMRQPSTSSATTRRCISSRPRDRTSSTNVGCPSSVLQCCVVRGAVWMERVALVVKGEKTAGSLSSPPYQTSPPSPSPCAPLVVEFVEQRLQDVSTPDAQLVGEPLHAAGACWPPRLALVVCRHSLLRSAHPQHVARHRELCVQEWNRWSK